MFNKLIQKVVPVEWREVGQHLPAAPPRQGVETQDFASLPLPVEFPDVRRQDVDLDDVTRIVLYELIDMPVRHFRVLEHVGRVVLVTYQPYGLYDPILPVPLINLGPAFKKAYKSLAFELSEWVSEMFGLTGRYREWASYNGYAHRMPPRPRPVATPAYAANMHAYANDAIAAAGLSDKWMSDEWQYFCFQMRLSVAEPDRFTKYDNPHWQGLWREAVKINNHLTNGGM